MLDEETRRALRGAGYEVTQRDADRWVITALGGVTAGRGGTLPEALARALASAAEQQRALSRRLETATSEAEQLRAQLATLKRAKAAG